MAGGGNELYSSFLWHLLICLSPFLLQNLFLNRWSYRGKAALCLDGLAQGKKGTKAIRLLLPGKTKTYAEAAVIWRVVAAISYTHEGREAVPRTAANNTEGASPWGSLLALLE